MHRLLIVLSVLLLLLKAGFAQSHDVVRCEPRAVIVLPGGTTTAAAFSPDGKLLATGGMAGDLILVDVQTKAVRWQCWPSDHWLGAIVFSPDGERVAAMGRHLTVHATATGVELARRSDTGPSTLCWSDDGRLLAYAAGDTVQVVETERYEFVRPWRKFAWPVTAMVFARDGETLFVGDNVGQIWRAVPTQEIPAERLYKHGNGQRCVLLARAGDGIVSFSDEGERRCDGRTTRLDGKMRPVALSEGGQTFVAGDAAGKGLWGTGNGAQPRELNLPAAITAAALDPERGVLFVATKNGDNQLYRGDAASVDLPGHCSRPGEIALSPDGTVMAVLHGDASWAESSGFLQPLTGQPPQHLEDCHAVGVGRSGAELLLLGKDSIKIVDGRSGQPVVAVTQEDLWFFGTPAVAVAAKGQLFMGQLFSQLIDPATGVLTRAPEPLYSEQWTADTALAANGLWAVGTASGVDGESGLLFVTDANGQQLFSEAGRPVATVDFAPDGNHLFYSLEILDGFGMCSPQRTVRIRDARTFALQREATAPISWWRYLDERYGLGLGQDGLQVWDVDRLQPVQAIDVGMPVVRACLSVDRRTLVVATPRDVRTFRLSALR